MTTETAPAPAPTTKREFAEALADSDVRLGVYAAAERAVAVRVWMREGKAYLAQVHATRATRGRL